MKLKSKEAPKLLKLDLGCGDNKREGFWGVDNRKTPSVDQVVDLMKFPWPWKDASVEEVHCSHFLEHVPGPTRIPWMDELWRIMTVGAKATMITPYWSSPRAIQDPSHAWPPIAEQSYLYFNKGWRDQNRLGHYLGTCDFDFVFGYILDGETQLKSQDVQLFWTKHYIGAVLDAQVTLTKRAKS